MSSETTLLGELSIDTAPAFDEARRKVLRLAGALGFCEIEAGRLASIFSDLVRPAPGCPGTSATVSLARGARGPALAIRFAPLADGEGREGLGPAVGYAARFFDSFEAAGHKDCPSAFLGLKHLPDAAFAATGEFIAAQRDMLARPSREELLLALEHKNAALEREVTERRLTEEALRASETRIQAVLEGTPDSLLIVDRAGLITYVNSQTEKTFGYHRAELLGQPVELLVPPESRAGHPARVGDFLREGRTRDLGMERNLHALAKDGRRIAVDIKLSPMATEAGPQVIASIRDVTEQKKAQALVTKLSLVVEQSPVSVAITDKSGVIEYVNPAFCTTTGYARDEVIGRTPSLLKSGKTAPDVYKDMWETITAGRIWKGLFINRKKNGRDFWESTAVAPIFNQENAITHFAAVKEDITERIRSEEELKRQRTLLDTLVNSLPLVIYSKDPQGVYQIANDSLCAMVGRPREEIVGRTAHELFPEETADHITQADQQALSDMRLMSEEDWRVYPDGRKALFHMTRVPVRDDEGRATGLVGVFTDITERKEAENAIRNAQAEMTQIFNTAAGGMRVIDTDFTVLKVNDAFLTMSGYAREELVGRKCHELFGGMDCHTEDCPLTRIVGGEGRVDSVALKQHRDGTPLYCEVSITRHLSPDGELIGIIEDFRDVTERMKAQHLIRQSEVKYRELVETAKSIILKLDMEGNITFFNEYAQQFFGFTPEEIIGRPIVGTIVPHTESGGRDLKALLQDIVRQPERYEKNENENQCKDGTKVWVSWTNQVVRDEISGQAREMLCIGLDATERKKAQDGLHDAMEVISGSIRYASRIQRAILPASDEFAQAFSNHFIVWNPRDVVGGDIYWSAAWGPGKLFVLGDCTGHGVPGAFMTLISTGALAKALGEVEPGRPGLLMRRAHQIVQSNLNQHVDGGDSDDGMELGMCYLEPGARKMLFVGARFPLFIDEGGEIVEIKADRKGIGYRGIPHGQEFSERSIDLRPGLRLYMASDGVFDQIGGEKRRGFGKNRFKELLLSLADVPFEAHGRHIYEALSAHQGNESRRDDVSILGLEY